MFNTDPDKNSSPNNKIMSASIGAGLAATYSAARGGSVLSCLMIMSIAVIGTLVLDEIGWV